MGKISISLPLFLKDGMFLEMIVKPFGVILGIIFNMSIVKDPKGWVRVYIQQELRYLLIVKWKLRRNNGLF